MPSENCVRRLSLDPINLEVELEAVVLRVLLQDVVEGRLHDPARGRVELADELRLSALVVAIAYLETPGLIVCPVARRAHLPEPPLCREPGLQVVGFGRRRTRIAAAEGDHPVRQAEVSEDLLRVPDQLLVEAPALVRPTEDDLLHLVELVRPEDTLRVLAVCARLDSEAGAEPAVP